MLGLKALATGIGSFPHKDTESALELIFKYCPQIPFWPQLPKLDIREGMVAQFSEGLPCIELTDKGVFFNPEDKEKELEKFYERITANDVDYFKISGDFALGLHKFYQRLKKSDLKQIEYIKCQITGPFTFAASIKDEKGIALLHDPVFMQVIIEGLKMKTLWQLKFFKEFGKKIVIFIDEPYLACFGSAYTPINREDVIKGLTELTKEIIKTGTILSGVHCCGNTDWSIFTDINTIDIISFDAFGFLDKFILYADNLKNFINSGRGICWGIVPTNEFTVEETAELLTRKIKDGLDRLVKKGLNKNLLLENMLLSPACGLATLDTEKSEKILRVLSGTSSLIRKSFDKAR